MEANNLFSLIAFNLIFVKNKFQIYGLVLLIDTKLCIYEILLSIYIMNARR